MSRKENVLVSKFGQFSETNVLASKAFREDGERITTFEQLLPREKNENEDGGADSLLRRIYLVADGLQFVWPFIREGHKQVVSTRALTPVFPDRPVILESMSERPRVFKIHNMFSDEEGEALIEKAEHGLQKSTVGSTGSDGGAHTEKGRTSENAWDTTSPAAKAMITRSFNLTGIIEDSGKIDGLQVVRYLPGQFYNQHPDYFSASADPDFDFNPYSGGSNRFATVFMYINDVEEGGCTAFPHGKSSNPTEPPQYALDMFDKRSLEYKMVNICHRNLAVPPARGTAALFYSVTPDGQIDHTSLHGACPVIKGTKWGANIWIWNKQRYGQIQTGAPRNLKLHNTLDEDVYVTWEGHPNGKIPPGEDISIGTFEKHRFKAHLASYKEKAFAEFTVQYEPHDQEWTIKPKRPLLDPDEKLVGTSISKRNLRRQKIRHTPEPTIDEDPEMSEDL